MPDVTNLKSMYKTMVKDAFPDEITIKLGDEELRYSRRSWQIDGGSKGLRYGENPDQPAALYRLDFGLLDIGGTKYRAHGLGIVSALTEGQILQGGKHPGKINLTDVDNGINILQYLTERPATVILKHNNPCGVAWSRKSLSDAFSKALRCDRIAAFGGAIVVNRPIDIEVANMIAENYFEVVAAPGFESGCIEILTSRKNLRIFELPQLLHLEKFVGVPYLDIKSLSDGGIILQQSFINRIRTYEDFIPATAQKPDGTIVTARSPSKNEYDDLIFAWAVEAGVTSNSVIFAKDGATVAIGTGEQDRVGCVELAVYKAYTKYADLICFDKLHCSLYELKQKSKADEKAKFDLDEILEQTKDAKAGLIGSVVVSDGFFPFRDGVDVCIAEGVSAIAHPGGSIRDFEVIEAVNEATPMVAMAFTGQRSFKH